MATDGNIYSRPRRTLACQDIDAAISTLMMVAGLPRSYMGKISSQSFIQQAKDFERMDYEGLTKWIKFFVNLENKTPWAVLRASELMQWYESGEYQKIIDRQVAGKFCGFCGNQILATSQYCGSCGKYLF